MLQLWYWVLVALVVALEEAWVACAAQTAIHVVVERLDVAHAFYHAYDEHVDGEHEPWDDGVEIHHAWFDVRVVVVAACVHEAWAQCRAT